LLTCDECSYLKTYVNKRRMEELDTDEVIWLHVCQHPKVQQTEVKDLLIADNCKHFDDDIWLK